VPHVLPAEVHRVVQDLRYRVSGRVEPSRGCGRDEHRSRRSVGSIRRTLSGASNGSISGVVKVGLMAR